MLCIQGFNRMSLISVSVICHPWGAAVLGWRTEAVLTWFGSSEETGLFLTQCQASVSSSLSGESDSVMCFLEQWALGLKFTMPTGFTRLWPHCRASCAELTSSWHQMCLWSSSSSAVFCAPLHYHKGLWGHLSSVLSALYTSCQPLTHSNETFSTLSSLCKHVACCWLPPLLMWCVISQPGLRRAFSLPDSATSSC